MGGLVFSLDEAPIIIRRCNLPEALVFARAMPRPMSVYQSMEGL